MSTSLTLIISSWFSLSCPPFPAGFAGFVSCLRGLRCESYPNPGLQRLYVSVRNTVVRAETRDPPRGVAPTSAGADVLAPAPDADACLRSCSWKLTNARRGAPESSMAASIRTAASRACLDALSRWIRLPRLASDARATDARGSGGRRRGIKNVRLRVVGSGGTFRGTGRHLMFDRRKCATASTYDGISNRPFVGNDEFRRRTIGRLDSPFREFGTAEVSLTYRLDAANRPRKGHSSPLLSRRAWAGAVRRG
jgi:hypothetical protein